VTPKQESQKKRINFCPNMMAIKQFLSLMEGMSKEKLNTVAGTRFQPGKQMFGKS
jgi:hypothetical protein